MNWYIGQEVIYLGPTVAGWVKGEDGIITSIRRDCNHFPLTININSKRVPDKFEVVCEHCHHTSYSGELMHLSEKNFAPLMDISELESLLKEETINK